MLNSVPSNEYRLHFSMCSCSQQFIRHCILKPYLRKIGYILTFSMTSAFDQLNLCHNTFAVSLVRINLRMIFICLTLLTPYNLIMINDKQKTIYFILSKRFFPSEIEKKLRCMFMNFIKINGLLLVQQKTVEVSFDSRFIRHDQKHVGLARRATPFLRCFWSCKINTLTWNSLYTNLASPSRQS